MLCMGQKLFCMWRGTYNDCLIVQKSQQVGRETGRPTGGVASPVGPLNNHGHMVSASKPAAIQSFVQPRAEGKVFALTQQDARTSNAVVEGMIPLAGHNARALFDPGATHSFVSDTLAFKLNQPPESLNL